MSILKNTNMKRLDTYYEKDYTEEEKKSHEMGLSGLEDNIIGAKQEKEKEEDNIIYKLEKKDNIENNILATLNPSNFASGV